MLNKENKMLLRHYEHSLPSWSVVMATYAVYRPSFRKFQYWLMMFISIVSMIIGFFDLYKNIPFIRSFLYFYMDSIWDWLEDHLLFRMTFLFGYVISGSSSALSIFMFISDFMINYPFNAIYLLLKYLVDIINYIKRLFISLKFLIYSQHEVQVASYAVGFAADTFFNWGVLSLKSVLFSLKAVYNTFVYWLRNWKI